MAEQKNTKDNQFSTVVGALMENASILMTSKTVIGDPITVGDTIIIPLSDVSVGCGAGSNGASSRDSGMGGFSAKISPSAVLVIREGVTKVVNIKEQNYVTKIVDMVPDVVDRFSAAIRGKSMMSDEEAAGIAFPDETQKDS